MPSVTTRKTLEDVVLHSQIILAIALLQSLAAPLFTAISIGLQDLLGAEFGLIDLRVWHKRGTFYLITGVLLAWFITDFFFYWNHRLCHSSKILWQSHKIHHMDENFDAFTGPRQNWADVIFGFAFVSLPTSLIFKLDSTRPKDLHEICGIITSAILFFFYLNHSNMKFQLGRYSCLIMTTQTHRIHHSRLPEHFDKNFAAWFPIWDIIFGTYYAPRWDEFPPTGVEGEDRIENFWQSQSITQRHWWRMFRKWRTDRNVKNV